MCWCSTHLLVFHVGAFPYLQLHVPFLKHRFDCYCQQIDRKTQRQLCFYSSAAQSSVIGQAYVHAAETTFPPAFNIKWSVESVRKWTVCFWFISKNGLTGFMVSVFKCSSSSFSRLWTNWGKIDKNHMSMHLVTVGRKNSLSTGRDRW